VTRVPRQFHRGGVSGHAHDADDRSSAGSADAADFIANAVALTYTNNETGACEISGSVQPVIDENFDECMGSITITWDSTVVCGHVLSHVQTITIEPAQAPAFVSTPNDTTITCADAANYNDKTYEINSHKKVTDA
jgi:hypothetical protein